MQIGLLSMNDWMILTKKFLCIGWMMDRWKLLIYCEYMKSPNGTLLLYDVKLLEESYQVHHQRRLFLFKVCLTQWGKNLSSWMLSVKNYSLKWGMQLKVKSKTWSKSKKFWKIIIINNVTNLYLYFSSIYILEGLSILVPICTF